ncbi:MAG TPA: FAD-dependent oxidoreductase, partial [Ktedonobacteraceae bacterium]|nr:FAD-dependent oxidoreductase [Ktedonobacteraceae bacterium]
MKPTVIVIGAGPGGLAAAHHLANSRQVSVTLVQRGGVSQYLPGILPVLLGMQQGAAYQRRIELSDLPHATLLSGEVVGLRPGSVTLADGAVLHADAVIAAPGLVTDAAAIPSGARSFAVWELEQAQLAQVAVQAFGSGRIAVVVTALPYRCPPAPYGLALSLKALFEARGQNVEVVLVTPESRPLQSLVDRVSDFLKQLASQGNVLIETDFLLDGAACRDGLLAAVDGRKIPYDLGLFIPPHRRPAFLVELPGSGPLVQVDANMRTAMDNTWVVGDVAATPLPRAAGVAEAQGRSAAEDVMLVLGLRDAAVPAIPAPSCYV